MKSLRLMLALSLVVVLAFGAAGCGGKSKGGKYAALVNGEGISASELDKQFAQVKKSNPNMFTGADAEGRALDFKRRLLDNMINQELLKQAAADKKIKVTDSEIDKQIEQLKSGFKDKKQFESALKSAGMTTESLKTQIRDQVLTQRLIDSLSKGEDITDAEIKAYYDKNKTQFIVKAAKRASHILFKPEDRAKAQGVLKQVQDGGDFAGLAKANSVDTASASRGGDLGWPSTPYVAEFEAALAKLSKGETSGLVKSAYGWHIIRVTDARASSQKSMAESRDQIAQILSQERKAEAYQKFLQAAKKKAKIEILIDELKDGGSTEKDEKKK